MNFFGGGSQQAPQGPDPVFAAKTEMEMYTVRKLRATRIAKSRRQDRLLSLYTFFACSIHKDLFNKIAASCFTKCASRKHKDAEISLGEMSCTDRCVSKYLESQQRVGAVLQKANEAQLEQQKNLEAMQKSFG